MSTFTLDGIEHPISHFKCNKANMRLAVAELRKPEYEQGHGYLLTTAPRSDIRHWCCLAVMCDVSGTGHWVPEPEQDRDLESRYINCLIYVPNEENDDDRPNKHYLTPGVIAWLGLPNFGVPNWSRVPVSITPARHIYADMLNDSHEFSLLAIADILEEAYDLKLSDEDQPRVDELRTRQQDGIITDAEVNELHRLTHPDAAATV